MHPHKLQCILCMKCINYYDKMLLQFFFFFLIASNLLFSFLMLFVHRNCISVWLTWDGWRIIGMGQEMRAQAHLPVHTAPELWLFLVSSLAFFILILSFLFWLLQSEIQETILPAISYNEHIYSIQILWHICMSSQRLTNNNNNNKQ